MKKKNFTFYIVTCLGLGVLFSGCVSPMGMTSSTTPLQGKEIRVMGKASGLSNWSGAVFGLWSVNRADINRAIDNALKLESNVTLVREDDRKELVMKKGVVLSAAGAEVISLPKPETAQKGKNAKKELVRYELKKDDTILFKDNKLIHTVKDAENEVPPHGLIVTGCGVELQYRMVDIKADVEAQEPVREYILEKVKGDMLVYVHDRLTRLKDNEVLKITDGCILQKVEGSALINVRWYERTYFFVLFSLHRVFVTGDVVRFAPIAKSEAVNDGGATRDTRMYKRTSRTKPVKR